MAVRSGAWGLEESRCHLSLQKGQGGVPRGTAASPQSLEMWTALFWRPSLRTWKTRKWPEIVSMDSLKLYHAQPTQLSSTVTKLPGWVRGEEWIFSTWTSPSPLTLSLTIPSEADLGGADLPRCFCYGGVVCEVVWELAEWQKTWPSPYCSLIHQWVGWRGRCLLRKFTDDTKLGTVADSPECWGRVLTG